MKFHRTLLIITAINAIACPLFFYFLGVIQRDDRNASGINLSIGWIFWLGMFCVIAPAFLRDETKSILFSKLYFGSTMLQIVANITIPIVVSIMLS